MRQREETKEIVEQRYWGWGEGGRGGGREGVSERVGEKGRKKKIVRDFT